MNTNSNSFYGAILGALVVVFAFALFSTKSAWRDILLGPPAPQQSLLPPPAPADQKPAAEPGEAGSSLSSAADDSARTPLPPETNLKPLGYNSPTTRTRPSLPKPPQSPASQRRAGLLAVGEREPQPSLGELHLSDEIRNRLLGPRVNMDAIVYDRPDGEPLPAPSLTHDALTVLRGTRVRLGERRGIWQEVLTPAGQRGWVYASQVSARAASQS
jgi:hypothetical protein